MNTTDAPEIASVGADNGQQAGAETAQPELKDAGLAHQQNDEAEGADQSPDSPAENLTDEQKTIRKLQRRIDRLTAKRGGTERENELLRQQIERYNQQIEAVEQGEGDKPRGKFTESDIERIAQARVAELHQQRTIGERVSKVLAAGAKIEGFNSAVDTVAEVVPFTDRKGKPTPFIEAVLEADDPAALLAYLGNNAEEAEDLADLNPVQLGRRIAKLEDRLKQGAKKSASAAPKPLKPITGQGTVQPDEAKLSDAEWRALRFKHR